LRQNIRCRTSRCQRVQCGFGAAAEEPAVRVNDGVAQAAGAKPIPVSIMAAEEKCALL